LEYLGILYSSKLNNKDLLNMLLYYSTFLKPLCPQDMPIIENSNDEDSSKSV
jgi:hypothetical protein